MSAVKTLYDNGEGMSDIRLGMGVGIKADKDCRGIGRPQIAMHRNCHIFQFRFIKLILYFCRYWSVLSCGRGGDGIDFDYAGRRHGSVSEDGIKMGVPVLRRNGRRR